MNRPFHSARGIRRLKNNLNSSLDQLCDILSQDLQLDRGIQVPADPDQPWPVVDVDVPVRIDPSIRMPRNAQAGEAITSEGSYNAVFEAGTDIRNTDRIRVTTMGNRVFEMIGPRYASYEIGRIMACEEIV
jgi:hypothetical protein